MNSSTLRAAAEELLRRGPDPNNSVRLTAAYSQMLCPTTMSILPSVKWVGKVGHPVGLV